MNGIYHTLVADVTVDDDRVGFDESVGQLDFSGVLLLDSGGCYARQLSCDYWKFQIDIDLFEKSVLLYQLNYSNFSLSST